MMCFKCKKKPASISLKHIPGKLCNSCFIKVIEKRVRKDVRLKRLFSRDDHILILDDKTKESIVSQYLLNSILNHLPVTIFIFEIEDRFNLDEKNLKAIVRTGCINKIVLPWSLDDEGECFLSKMFGKLDFEKQKKPERIKLLRNVSEKEIEVFAKIKRFKYKKLKPYNKDIREMLNTLEKKHPEIKFSVLKSFDSLVGIIDQN